MGRGEASLAGLMGLPAAAVERLVEEALGLAEAGRLAEAEAQLARVTLVEGDSPLLPLLLGTIRAELGAHAAALAAYDEALTRHVESGGHARFEAEVRLLRGRALLALGHREDAELELLLAAAGPDAAVARGAQALLTTLRLGA